MQARYFPWWMPGVIVVLCGLCVVLFASLVMKSTVAKSAGINSNASLNGGDQIQQQVFQWKLVTTWPKRFPGLGLAPENFAEMVDRMSNGRLKIQVHGANEIVPALGVFGAVSSGSVQMGHSSAYYWKGKVPASVFFTSIPFGLNAQEYNGWLHYGGGLELWREVYEGAKI